ncbi:MAG: DNA lyase [Candidatus Pacearchaeota archaeon]
MEQKLIKELKKSYKLKKSRITAKLNWFKSLSESEQKKEFMFCLLTPQSNAQRCWEAVEQLNLLNKFTDDKIKEILKAKTRFYNNKTKYILEAEKTWNNLKQKLKINDKKDSIKNLRNWLADNVKGYGLKEASHFLRNIGKSNNQIAILDRHIVRNMKKFGIITDESIKSGRDYLEKEQKFLEFSKKIGIPADELDLLFWSNENGEIFK